MGEPPEAIRDMSAGWRRKRGGERTSNDGRCRHVAQGAETSGRGWWGEGVDNVQVDGIPLWERRWGEIETEGCYNYKLLLIEGGRIEG